MRVLIKGERLVNGMNRENTCRGGEGGAVEPLERKIERERERERDAKMR